MHRALIVVDVQNDFCEGGGVAVPGGGDVAAAITDLIGETALLSGGQFKSDVIAQGKSRARGRPAADGREMIITHPHVVEYIGEAAEQSRKLQIL